MLYRIFILNKQRFIKYVLNTLGNCEGSLEAATNEYEAMSEVYEDNTYGNPELDAEEVLSYWE